MTCSVFTEACSIRNELVRHRAPRLGVPLADAAARADAHEHHVLTLMNVTCLRSRRRPCLRSRTQLPTLLERARCLPLPKVGKGLEGSVENVAREALNAQRI